MRRASFGLVGSSVRPTRFDFDRRGGGDGADAVVDWFGPTDFVGRTVGQKLSGLLGQQIIVDNRPGGGSIAMVCVEAASAVCIMNITTASGSRGGIGVGVINDGTHPSSQDRVIQQVSSFIFGDAIFPLVCDDKFSYSTISFTRPTAPLSRRTLIP